MDKKNAVLPGSACVHMFLYGLAPAAPDCAGKIRTINAGSPRIFPAWASPLRPTKQYLLYNFAANDPAF